MLYGLEGFSRAFSHEDVVDCMLVLIQEARGQEFLVSKFHSQLGGIRLEILVLFLGCFVVVEGHLDGY